MVQRRAIVSHSGVSPFKPIGLFMGAVIRHKNIFHHNVVGSSTREAHGIPCIFNTVIALGKEECTVRAVR